MRIAIFSDVHGNPYALDAVLAQIHEDGHFDHIVVAGDIAFGGSDPVCCIDRIRDLRLEVVYGNTEVYIHSPGVTPGDALHLKKWEKLKTDALWIREKIGTDRINWLASLPFDLTFSPTANAKDDLLVFHANPKTIEEMLLPPYEDQRKLFGNVVQPDDDPNLIRLFENVTPKTIAFGHYHYTSERLWRDYRLINVAPVSMPSKDHDPRARYTIFDWNDNRWQIERRFTKYDYAQEIQALASSGLPCWNDHAKAFPTP